MEPPVTVSRNQGAKIPDKREKGASQSTVKNGGETSPASVIYGHFLVFDQLFDTVWARSKNRASILATPSVPSQEPRS
jgi:hypothetical protein